MLTLSGGPAARGAVRPWLWGAGLGIVLRVVAVLATPVFPVVANTWDSRFYHETAASLASGEGYTFQGEPTAYYPPGYPFLLAAAYRVGGAHPRTGQILNLLASLAVLGGGAWLAGELAGRRAARWTALLLALEPSQIVMPAFLMSETVCAAALTLALAALVRFARSRSFPWLPAAAVLGAYAGMVRGHAFLVLPVVVLALWGWKRMDRRAALTALMVLILADVAVLGGWAARNRRELGSPVPIATNGGINLLLGNNPDARGGRADPPGGLPETGNEVENERLASARALDYIRAHPGRFLALMPVKAARLLLPAPALTYRAELAAKWGRAPAWVVLVLAQLFHLAGWVLAGIAGIREWRRRRIRGAPVLRLAGSGLGIWTLGHLPFLGGARYFFPVSPLLWTAAGAGAAAPETEAPPAAKAERTGPAAPGQR